jgi:hypothetical protein
MMATLLAPKEYVLDLRIPGLPPTYNSIGRKGHWRLLKATHEWKNQVRYRVGRFLPSQALTKAAVTLTRCSSHESDYDGLVHSFKPILDGLVECGVLADDSMKVIGVPQYRWEKAERGKGYIKVRVEEPSSQDLKSEERGKETRWNYNKL